MEFGTDLLTKLRREIFAAEARLRRIGDRRAFASRAQGHLTRRLTADAARRPHQPERRGLAAVQPKLRPKMAGSSSPSLPTASPPRPTSRCRRAGTCRTRPA